MELLTGIRCFTRGFGLATSRELRKYVLSPALFSFVLVFGGLAWAFTYVAELTQYVTAFLPEWASFLEWVIAPFLYLLGLLFGAWMFTFAATIIASPFLGELSKHVEYATSSVVAEFIDEPWYAQILPALARELRKLRYHLPRLLLLVLVSIVPVINIIAPLLWLGFGAWMMAAQFADYANENRGIRFTQTLELMRQKRLTALGFGGCTTLAMSIPFLNFFVVPVAVAGGTLLWQEMQGSEGVKGVKGLKAVNDRSSA